MKNQSLKPSNPSVFRKFITAFALAGALSAMSLQAQLDVVYVTSFTAGGINTCPPVCRLGGTISTFGSTEITTAPGVPTRSRTQYGVSGTPVWSIQPTLNVAGAVYKIETAHNSGTAASTSCSTDVLVTLSSPDGDLTASCTNTPVFQRSYGGPIWQLIGYITNYPGVTQPTITFTHTGGTVAGGSGQTQRLYLDAFKFSEVNNCSGVAGDVSIGGPLAAGQTFVNVLQVDGAASGITVYADGSPIGTLNSGIVAGLNVVPTTALVKDTEIKATQTKNGCTSAMPGSGIIVGGGANPTVNAFLSCWQNAAYAGPVGTNSAPPGNGVFYVLKGAGLTGGSQSAPTGGQQLAPSQCWQTVTFDHNGDTALRTDSGTFLQITEPFCALDALVFTIDSGTADSGPYDIYVDQIKNGDIVIEDFEGYAEGSVGRFRAPNLATIPNPAAQFNTASNSAVISTSNSFDGTKACRIQWQWNNNSIVRWARVQANAATTNRYPQLDTTKPITVRYLVLPVGQTTNSLHFPSVPVNQTKSTNETVTFTVEAVGDAPVTYQWQFAGSDITGETGSSYTKSNVQLVDAGVYSVNVTGTTCSTPITHTATLTVTEFVPPPVLTFQVSGSQVTLNWTDGAAVLQEATALTGQQSDWTDVPSQTNPWIVDTSTGGPAKFYRLRR